MSAYTDGLEGQIEQLQDEVAELAERVTKQQELLDKIVDLANG